MFTEHDKNSKYTITGMKDAVKGPLLEIKCITNEVCTGNPKILNPKP